MMTLEEVHGPNQIRYAAFFLAILKCVWFFVCLDIADKQED